MFQSFLNDLNIAEETISANKLSLVYTKVFRHFRLSMKARARELTVIDLKRTQDETFSFMFIFLMRKILMSDFW